MIDASRYHGASRRRGWYRCFAATAACVALLSQADCSRSEERPRHTRGFASASVAESQQTPPGAVVVAAGGYAVCAIRSGRAYCWGKVREDNGRTPAKTRPEPFGGAIVWRTIALAVRRGCGASVDGRTYCWGANDQGQLGREPDTLDHDAPLSLARCGTLPGPVDAGVRFGTLALGELGGGQACGEAEMGPPYCWGDTLIRISFDTVAAAHAPPRPVPGSPPLVRITGGRQHWCGLTRDQRA